MIPSRIRKYAIVAGLLSMVGVMVVGVSYSVTLYRLFCQATGAGGLTRRVTADNAAVSSRLVTVSFNTNVAPNLPWVFRPMQDHVTLHLGADTVVFFEAENTSNEDIVGHATFNVTPNKAGIYFKKIQCFCFTEERLGAHQKVEMPVDFFVDPGLGTDKSTQDVDNITLSYTFFRSEKPKGATDLARFENAPPDPVAGSKIFAAQCSACHNLDTAKIGPPLRTVIGRHAGSIAHYPYSQALASSNITWSPATLGPWLKNPRQDVPGALMPMSVPDPATRRDVIAYLQSLGDPS